ncbi:MAG: hypothetical protein LBB53_03940 [Prevotellaceae bacterium]|jgi:hypothetical protein|nr:hypothetical protein [Prevotellaceae bacterium]
MPPDIHIGNTILQYLAEHQRSVAWLARQINYDRSSLFTMLKEQPHPHPAILWRICVAIRLDLYAIYSVKLKEKNLVD